METTYLELHDDSKNAHKGWKLEHNPNTHQTKVSFGRIGAKFTHGAGDEWKTHGSHQSALAFIADMTKKKKKKGYSPVDEGMTAPLSPAKQRENSGYSKAEIAANNPPPKAAKAAKKLLVVDFDDDVAPSSKPKKEVAEKRVGPARAKQPPAKKSGVRTRLGGSRSNTEQIL